LQSVMRRLGGGDVPRHLVGRPAPDFSAETLSGDTLRLSDYRGEVVLLDFWASWCLPCRMEMPNVARVHDRYSSRGLQVIGVNLDAERSDADAAVSELGITWPQVLDGQMGSIARHYGVKSIPMTFLVGRDGTIVGVGLRGEELHSRVAEVLGAQ
ncbi:MAG: TlpA family protein disulfide reductase, partial [Armatimonadota bacterium]